MMQRLLLVLILFFILLTSPLIVHAADITLSSDGYALKGMEDNTIRLYDIARDKTLKTLKGHADVVISLALSPDGYYALSGSRDRTIKLWHLSTGREIKTFYGHAGDVTSVAFSPDGRHVVSGSSDKLVKIWDAESGREIKTLKGHKNEVISVAFSPDGNFVMSMGRDSLKLWNFSKAVIEWEYTEPGKELTVAAFSPDSKYIFAGIKPDALLSYDINTGKVTKDADIFGAGWKQYCIYSILFCWQERHILLCCSRKQ
ncbi:MAG: WD40 repeat domain-containing protein [Nitrospirota bacterium]